MKILDLIENEIDTMINDLKDINNGKENVSTFTLLANVIKIQSLIDGYKLGREYDTSNNTKWMR